MSTVAQAQATYQVGGSLKANDLTYVKRSADIELYHALKQREFCYVLNARQMGKSSLQVRTMARLRQEQICCVALDLTTLGNQQITPEQWYASILHELMVELQLDLDFMAWWEGLSQVSLINRVRLFLEEVLLAQILEPIVIFIDEVDSVLGLSFPCDDFFAFIRACYNRRSTHPRFERLTFVLFGVATPADFIADKRHTPFNIGRPIDLQGFEAPNAIPLVTGLQGRVPQPAETLHEILAWTNGQPFLTQKICQLVRDWGDQDPPQPFEDRGGVSALIQTRVIDQWRSQDEPEHLRTIQNRLLCDSEIANRLLGLYQRILLGDTIAADESREQLELRLSGLVIVEQGVLRVKNRIYQAIFTLDWVEQQLAMLRPYAVALQGWVASQCQDASWLLQGLTLKEALAWASQKQLSDLDYRFLQASQALTQQATEADLASEVLKREQAQIAVQAAADASHMLGRARRRVRLRKQMRAWRKRWVLTITAIVWGLVMLVRWTGGLQPLEWAVFDQFFQLRSVAPVAARVAVMTIDETDIQTLGQFPISDGALAQAIAYLKQCQPRMIGLDIYRDLPVQPGHDQLLQTLATTPNLVGIHKVVGTEIAPPPSLAQTEQYGFADQVLDSDGTVRRGLLTIQMNDRLHYSLALKLALGYLAQDDIQPQFLANHRTRIGRTTLVPLRPNDGGYVRADTGGYQILLNYHGDTPQFETFGLRQVLAGQVPAAVIRDRVILIGVTAPTVNDLLLTPYSRHINGIPTQMPGVVVHANIVSQLLSAALENRPLMRVWPVELNVAWLVLWSLLGTLLGRWRRLWSVLLAVVLASLALASCCYLAFLQGWWLPMVPAMMGVGLGAIARAILTARQSERLILRLIVADILAQRQDKPAAVQIAIEYLKHGENQRNQRLIESIVDQLPNPFTC